MELSPLSSHFESRREARAVRPVVNALSGTSTAIATVKPLRHVGSLLIPLSAPRKLSHVICPHYPHLDSVQRGRKKLSGIPGWNGLDPQATMQRAAGL